MTVDLAEIARYMRMGTSVPDGLLAERVTKLRDEGLASMRPSRTWRRFPVEDGAVGSGGLRLGISGKLACHMDGCHAAYLDTFQRRASVSSGVDALAVQAIGAALIEKFMDSIEDDIRSELFPGESLVQRYSPGYGDFPLAAQRTLLDLLDAPRTVGVALTDTLLMVPSKSVSAVIGVKKGESPK